jgi:hypothetical protein
MERLDRRQTFFRPRTGVKAETPFKMPQRGVRPGDSASVDTAPLGVPAEGRRQPSPDGGGSRRRLGTSSTRRGAASERHSRVQAMAKKSGSLKAGIAAMIFGLVLALALVETIPRLLPGLMPKKVQAVQRIYAARNSWEDMMRGDREIGFVLRPGLDLDFPSEGREIHITTKALPGFDIGFRDIGTKPPYDMIAVGDSFTFCDDAPVQSCWVRHLADRTGTSVATLGVNGYSNLAEERLLAKVGPSLKPRITLIGFFPNDFKDNLHFENWTQSGTDDYWTWMRRKRRSDLSETLARNSFIYRLVDAARRYGKRDTFEYNENGINFVFRADGWWKTVLQSPGGTPGFKLAEKAFADMSQTTAKMGSKLVILLFPFKEQVYWDIARRYSNGGDRLTQADVDAPLDALKSSLEQAGIRYCDLLPDLRASADEGKQLYLRVGAHWNDAGNSVAADSIARCLTHYGLLEPHDGLTERTPPHA